MAQQTVRTTLDVDASKAVSGFRAGEKAAGSYGSKLDQVAGSVRDSRQAWDTIGDTALIAGGAMAAGLGLATKAAIDWESAWAGVAKTTEGTPAQMAELEGELRNLATVLPATHEEIAGVAEAAGQLGIARQDIADFTETAIALGESTNLSAEEAATGLAKISNVMGTQAEYGIEGIERMGSALVALGNDGASTEADILAMGQRLAGAGETIGATEADILAMSNALSSVGIEAELGGGAMSRALLEMNSAVISGGDELEKFADIAGMSASEFASAWRKDPIAATNAFITGLGGISASGGDAAAALESVGLGGTQNAQVLLRAAGASDTLTASLKTGRDAWKDNAALQEEAQRRYETTASKLQIATNTMKNAAIDLGATFGPALAEVASWAADAADAFVKLPGPVQKAAGGLSGLAAAGLLIGGSAVKVVGWGQDMRQAMRDVSGAGPKADKAIRGVAKAAGALAVLQVGRIAMGSLQESMQEAIPTADMLTASLLELGDSSGNMAKLNEQVQALELKGQVEGGIRGVGDAVAYLNDMSGRDEAHNFMQNLVGMQSDADRLREYLSGVDEALASLYAQDPAAANAAWEGFVREADAAGVSVKELKALFPQYAGAVELAGQKTKTAGGDMAGMGEKALTAEQQVDGLADAIKGLGDTILAQSDAQVGYHAALDDLTASIKENGATLDVNTAAGRANQSALNDLAQSAQDYAVATLEQTGSVKDAEAILSSARGQYINMATAMGMSKSEASALADELFRIPKDVKSKFSTPGADKAKADAKGVKGAVDSVPGSKTTKLSVSDVNQSKVKVLSLKDTITNLKGKTVSVRQAGADVSNQKVVQLDGAILGLKGKTVTVTEIGTTSAGERVVRFKDKVYAIPNSKNVKVSETGAAGSGARVAGLNEKIRTLSGKTVTVSEGGALSAKGRVLQLDGSILGLDGKRVTVTEIGSTAAGERVVRLGNKIYVLDGKTVKVSETGATSAEGRVRGLIGEINSLFGKDVPVTESGASDSKRRVDNLDGSIDVLSGKTVDARANTYGKGDVDALDRSIDGLRSKTVTVRTIAKRIGKWYADGGIEHYGSTRMADGGTKSFRGQLPHIRAAGGGGVTWAEEGAGPWEAWISGHPGKATRSKAIADDVVARLGGTVVWPHRHADGGIDMHSARSYSPTPRTASTNVTVVAPSGPSTVTLTKQQIQQIADAVYEGSRFGSAQQTKDQMARQSARTMRRNR